MWEWMIVVDCRLHRYDSEQPSRAHPPIHSHRREKHDSCAHTNPQHWLKHTLRGALCLHFEDISGEFSMERLTHPTKPTAPN
ncbi:hypothetical protein Q8A67_006251 [Cirrhinus molitorella]|uniref:Uncharacterized protein n=1 Tax=Cirrhinus molitorella TaxID=172907 RepID=A0AA88Q1S3_9TELE|nr:hypothetical protein Q8A67_006251 [Cirrhinus molitorella]